MISIKRYSESDKVIWNDFNECSKTPLFMFNRNYMDYHKDRFQDHSLFFYNEDELIALFPASETDGLLISHGGLTYGGFIVSTKMKQHIMDECIIALKDYCKSICVKKVIYKTIPHIYATQPAEEDRYALFKNNAILSKVEPSTVLNLQCPLKMPKGRKAQISRAKRENVTIKELVTQEDFNKFIEIENSVLISKHGTHAVHTGNELSMLHDRFPSNIHLYAALVDNEIIAGSVLFEYENVVHTQYMAANDMAREVGALDLTISSVIENYRTSKKWLDFGISTENNGQLLNQGLISQKEGFGGRTVVYETWELNI